MGTKMISFIKKETILCISLLLAVISAFFVHPDSGYANYVDRNTLMLLFSLMAVMAGLQQLGVFRKIGATLLSHTKNTRQLALILVFLPFFFSMLITNVPYRFCKAYASLHGCGSFMSVDYNFLF